MDFLPFTIEELLKLIWHKASESAPDGNCVEVAHAPNSLVAVRDSKDRSGPVLAFSPGQWDSFLSGISRGDFDL
ncbi:DUF397 domain-containing protein [Nocardia sp. 2]|uniref:DUF397 domain-containing protein n=1 Tax=Nocardia acididurans TaxID=2802282 RepID=A0ABS1MLC2_9NOCA|nr:DUF397 domain-containing protein [Nocardia acididurans]MBL1080108.1 DUF397 domain-containing protein [Nocardia acididurans]